MWKSISKGSGVWITRIPEKAVVGYLTKYLTKAGTVDSLTAETSASLKGMRLFSPFGTWYKMNIKYIKPASKCSKCGTLGSLDLYYNITGEADFGHTAEVAYVDGRGWLTIDQQQTTLPI